MFLDLYFITYRGAAHNQCNLKYQELKILPVVFHNFDYDQNFILSTLAQKFKGEIKILPKNSERYLSITKVIPKCELESTNDNDVDDNSKTNYRENLKLRFIDSYRFLPASLAKIVETIPKENLKITKSEWKHLNEEQYECIIRKGVMCYQYLSNIEKLNEKQLPSIEAFYNRLNDSNISDEEYEFAQQVFRTFGCQTIGDYVEIYLKTDVLLLADCFENFREKCLNLYGLEPSYYYSMPGLTFDAMLKYTKVEIELLTDIDQLLFIEKCKYKCTYKLIYYIYTQYF